MPLASFLVPTGSAVTRGGGGVRLLLPEILRVLTLRVQQQGLQEMITGGCREQGSVGVRAGALVSGSRDADPWD